MPKVALGFSGGVDSAVSSYLLKKAGCEVFGVYLDNASEKEKLDAVKGAEYAGIPLEIIDVKHELDEKVCSYFEQAYLNGETPNPCIICNRVLKFKNLIEYADRCGCEFISTGHYARSENGALFKGRAENDQSYMLCRILPSQLERLILPLGTYAKSTVREIATDIGLPAAAKPDSMEICFIPDKNYIKWLGERCSLPGEGNFIFHGEITGQHSGIYRYTVGQRLPGLIDGRKVYISKINPMDNTITLSLWEELFTNDVYASDFSYLVDMPDSFEASIRVRHTKWEEPACTVEKLGAGIHASCFNPVRAPARGQSAVLYKDDRVIGGGFICDSTSF